MDHHSHYLYAPTSPSFEAAPTGSVGHGWFNPSERLTPSPYGSSGHPNFKPLATSSTMIRPPPSDSSDENPDRYRSITNVLRDAGMGANFTPEDVGLALGIYRTPQGAHRAGPTPPGLFNEGRGMFEQGDNTSQLDAGLHQYDLIHSYTPALTLTPSSPRNESYNTSYGRPHQLECPPGFPDRLASPLLQVGSYRGAASKAWPSNSDLVTVGAPSSTATKPVTPFWNRHGALTPSKLKLSDVPPTSEDLAGTADPDTQDPSPTTTAEVNIGADSLVSNDMTGDGNYFLPNLGLSSLLESRAASRNAHTHHTRAISDVTGTQRPAGVPSRPRTMTTQTFVGQGQLRPASGLHHPFMGNLFGTQQGEGLSRSAPSRSSQREFRPMEAILNKTGTNNHGQSGLLSSSQPNSAGGGFSSNYHGKHTERNASKDWLSDDENSSLWICNLPPDVSYHELLGLIRGVGRVHCTVINRPDPGKHPGAAAKVVFYEASAAQTFHAWINQRRPYIRGFGLTCKHNRIKTSSEPLDGTSRVVIITGQSWYVNQANLTRLFTPSFVYQLDEVIELAHSGGRTVLEFRFGSYRCQSEMAMIWMKKCAPAAVEMVEYGPDPCEIGDSTISRQIAAERINGKGLVWPWPRYEDTQS